MMIKQRIAPKHPYKSRRDFLESKRHRGVRRAPERYAVVPVRKSKQPYIANAISQHLDNTIDQEEKDINKTIEFLNWYLAQEELIEELQKEKNGKKIKKKNEVI